jgi:iron(III) transport system permease protein
MILLAFTLTAFLAQRVWLSGKSFATVTGKGDSGAHRPAPPCRSPSTRSSSRG